MTSDNAMEVAENALEPMEDSSTSSSGSEEGESGGQEDMEGSDQEEEEEKAANPAFSKFMQGFWDLASVDVPVRCVALGAPACCKHQFNPRVQSSFFFGWTCCDFASVSKKGESYICR